MKRFWDKVNKTETCWLWIGWTDKDGYGTIKFSNPRKNIRVHRLSYELHNGTIPKGLLVCHTCDVRNCVNPDHLFLGTNQENTDDMKQKNRQARPKGELQYNHKLTDKEILDIRSRNRYYGDQTALAREFNVSQPTINMVIHRQRWKHI